MAACPGRGPFLGEVQVDSPVPDVFGGVGPVVATEAEEDGLGPAVAGVTVIADAAGGAGVGGGDEHEVPLVFEGLVLELAPDAVPALG